MPNPPRLQNCHTVEAGPLRLVVEARDLVDENKDVPDDSAFDASPAELELANRMREAVTDFGATLHVFDTAEDLERLRFDCFQTDPHYHYIRNQKQTNLIVRFDDIANASAIDFTLSCVSTRLPEMLEHAEAPDAAAAVRSDPAAIRAAVEQVRDLLTQAQERAFQRRSAADAPSSR
jgi:hypothetical protein